MTASFRLSYARANVLFGVGDERAGLYRLGDVSYPFLPVAEKWRWLHRLERFAALIGADFSLWRVSRAYPAARYPQDMAGLLDERGQSPQVWRAFLAAQQHRLAALDAHSPEIYLAVALAQETASGLGGGLVRSLDRARRRLEVLAGVGTPQPISASELEALATVEERVDERLRVALPARRATSAELEWLLRRAALRGVDEPPASASAWKPDALVVEAENGELAYEPLGHDLLRLANAPLSEPKTGPGRLRVEAEEADSHQAFLCLGTLADAPLFPGPSAELLFAPLEQLGFPVDAVLHARWLGNRQALAQVRKRITDVEQVYREQAEGSRHGPGWLAEEDRVLAREYEAVLQSSAHPPMLYASIGLAVGARDEEELERRVTALRDAYGDIELHRPRGLQERLFFDHLPQPGGGTVSDYVNQLTVEQFGALMPTATQRVASEHGIYLGYTTAGRPRPVRYDPTEPSREARSSAVLLAGTLGSGKTVGALTIGHAAERRGSQVIDFDPKPDHGWTRLPELAGRVAVLELSADPVHRGKLDPLAIGLEDLREELASSYLLELLHGAPPAWENAIGRAVHDVVRAGGRSSLLVIERLRALGSDAAREAAEALEVVADFGLGRLGFGSGGELGALAVAPVTTIRTPGLTLPEPGVARETYTRSERVSVATLALVAAYALRLASQDRTRHKVVILDEAWFLLASAQGRAVISRLLHVGRGLNVTVLLLNQRLRGELGDLSDLVGTYFVFGLESDAEAEAALKLVGRDPDDIELRGRLLGYRRGRCLMRDLHGRVAEVQFDPSAHELAAFDTTPDQVGA
jgi:hypothetical protein